MERVLPVTLSTVSAPLRKIEVLKHTPAKQISVGRRTKLYCRAHEFSAAGKPELRKNLSLKRRDSLFLGAGSALALRPEDALAKELSSEDAETLAVVKKVCKLLAKREFSELEELVHEECKVVKLGPSDLPYAGKYFGKTAVTDYFEKFDQFLRIEKIPETLFYIGEAKAIFVAQDYDYAVTSNFGVKLSTSVTMKMVVQDGKLKKMAIIGDTLSEYLTLMKAGGLAFMA
uniref:SnoaL-like domain-containing protein n=1 Tax=Pyramimonas obovata TaxID=1411642 RepID=A0A7S0QWN1_9CHLO|mmetsp:Transcript_14574/g.31219  ORF Transcript_14574/g.31219 Transcript_14574/m.31219 type:complete len:230 (+) Transcript_14574:80-769(+)|eukprot:CAMPEP_0118926518 /NCGR_PEP_ID=MMETSP1169-20130426/4193_1 /TAXON_ID=36882 /ORGANISM="Pyramimonas obovata, Strain CCMP722" /LENGTH=229 /DNA_ID=CAMNT_0006868085 /DNA_START=71 /DNA_END=760 /DNA_ORIENTATION=-